MPKYKAILFTADGTDYVTDYHDSDSVEEVEDLIENQGSRWFFYPFAAVIVDHSRVNMAQRVLSVPDIFSKSKGKSLKTFRDRIKSLSELELQRIFGYL